MYSSLLLTLIRQSLFRQKTTFAMHGHPLIKAAAAATVQGCGFKPQYCAFLKNGGGIRLDRHTYVHVCRFLHASL